MRKGLLKNLKSVLKEINLSYKDKINLYNFKSEFPNKKDKVKTRFLNILPNGTDASFFLDEENEILAYIYLLCRESKYRIRIDVLAEIYKPDKNAPKQILNIDSFYLNELSNKGKMNLISAKIRTVMEKASKLSPNIQEIVKCLFTLRSKQ